MNVTYARAKTLFKYLRIGEAYEDKNGYVSIKIAVDRCFFIDTNEIWDTIGEDEKRGGLSS